MAEQTNESPNRARKGTKPMTNTANMEVARLLAEVNVDLHTHPRNWTHPSGRALTPHEVTLILSARVEDIDAAGVLSRVNVEFAKLAFRTSYRLRDLLMPYFDANPHLKKVGEIVPLLTPEDRAEYNELAELMEVTHR